MRPFFFVRFFFAVNLMLWVVSETNGQDGNGVTEYDLKDTALASVLLTKADSLSKKFEYQESLNTTQEALKIYTQLGIIEEKVALCWNNLGTCYYYLGKIDEALSSFEKALKVFRTIHDEGHEEEAATLENIGTMQLLKGDFTKSLESLNKALALKLKVNDECRSDISSTYSNIASNYYYMSNIPLTIENMEKALQVRVRCLGDNDPGVATILNNLGFICRAIGKIQTAIEYSEKAAAVFFKLGDDRNPDLTACLDNLGVCYDALGDFDEGLRNFEKALELRQKYLGNDHPSMATSYGQIANHYDLAGNSERSIQHSKKAIEIYTKAGSGSDNDLATCYRILGSGFSGLGDYNKALECNMQSLNLSRKFLGEDHFGVAYAYNNVATQYYNLGENEKAIECYERALKIFLMSQEEIHPSTFSIYKNMAMAYGKHGDSEKASELIAKSLKICNQLFGDDSPHFASILTEFGGSSYLGGDTQKAIDSQKQAIRIWRKYGEHSQELAHSYLVLANNYRLIGSYKEAEEAYKLSLDALRFGENSSLSQVNSLPRLVETLFEFAQFYELWHRSGNPSNSCLENSRYFHHKVAEVLYFQFQSLSPSAKFNIAVPLNNNYAYASRVNYYLHILTDSLHYLTESFDFAERSKALLLYEAMQETNALSVAGIPDSLLQQEYNLRIDIAFYDKKRQEKLSEGASDTDSIVLAIGSRLLDLNEEYGALKSRFETGYPDYYKAKYDLSTISLKDVQNNLLQSGQSLLEYLTGDSVIYVFLVRPDTFVVREIKHDFPLDEWVQDMTKQGIYGYYALSKTDSLRRTEWNKTCTANYTRSAYQLYEKLVVPVADWMTEEVIVIPDGVLGYVPFEALLTTQPPKEAEGKFSYYDFMLKKHQISYCYSATLLREMRQKQHRQQPEEGLLAMAPFFYGDTTKLVVHLDSTDFLAKRDSLGSLEASGEEVKTVAELFKGKSWYKGQASLAKFRQEAGHYRILHLSTHGKADDRAGDYAYLAFGVPGDPAAFDKLYARDLYNYSLNADMVVLSACETGIGKLRRGEGIVSLARAFAYAGAKSIFTTLWKVSDAKTAELMRLFYKNLRKGMTKDAALRKAKLDFLKNNKGEASHPFFWAGMIGIGDMGPIQR